MLVRLVPGVPRMMTGEEGDFLNRRGELVKIERLILGLMGGSGEVIGCAQSGIFISTCLGLGSDEAKDCFRPENENSEATGEYSEYRESTEVFGLHSIDVLGLSGAKGTYLGTTIGTCFRRGLVGEGKFSKENVGNNRKLDWDSWSEKSRVAAEEWRVVAPRCTLPSRGTARG